jgi:hypothetical protein
MSTMSKAAAGATAASVTMLTLQGLTASALPTVMAFTGTVVSGVGTIQSGTTATLAAFSAGGAAFAWPVLLGGAIIGYIAS